MRGPRPAPRPLACARPPCVAPRNDTPVMADNTLARTVVVTNPQGVHARPANLFVQTANQFQSRIEVIKDGERVDGKSILSILTLAAVEGTRLEIVATGPDAEAALAALADLIGRNFDEQEIVEP